MSNPNLPFSLSGYRAIEEIARSESAVVYRGVEIDGQQRSVVIKLLVAAYPTHQEIIDFRHQYRISRHLDLDGVVRVYDLETYERGYALVMEDFGGISLASYAQMVKLSIADIIAIAIQITDILDAIGQQGIVHKDIKPSNILINPDTKQVKLIDFGIASVLPREMQPVVGPSALEGTLAYIAPEQTGRMNRGVDYRSDFYSLGVTLYQLLTDKLPFDTQDPLELIHAHLAIVPPPVCEVNPQVTPALSQIVAKLMAKDANLRYQTALGIKHDLELNDRDNFELGLGDICDRFSIPECLYGRELEIHTLLSAYERVAAGNSEMMLVAGNSGIGKTAVINEIHKPIARDRGYFIAGKFDQFDRNLPLSAFVSAFSDLVGQLLGESDDLLARWRDRIINIVGENGGVLTAVIPELELIIGRQPKPVELAGIAAQNRFNWLFQKFVGIFTTAAHPLTIFLDDLQWADAASLEFIKLLMEEDSYLFLLGAYRDNEVSNIHPMMATIDRLKKSGKIISTITLNPLSLADTNRLVADTLKCTPARAQPLTEFIYIKTQGNPFFTTQFLTLLHRDGEFKFDRQGRGWKCDIARIRTLSITDDVVAFMAAQLQKLPPQSRFLLQLAACYGDRFDLHTLAIIADRSPSDTATDLWCALQQGLILPIDRVYKLYQQVENEGNLIELYDRLPTAEYRFAHDRIQQAAYSLIPADDRAITHLKIGRLLLVNTDNFESSNRSLKIVDLLNAGESAIDDLIERIQLMKMNLWAAKKAKSNTADRAALNYSLQGIKLLGANPWPQYYQSALELYELAADSAYLTGERNLDSYIDIVLAHAIDPLDRCGVSKTKILAAIGKMNLEMAIDLTIDALAELDLKLDKQVDRTTATAEILETEAILIGKNLHEIDRLPPIVDRRIIATMGFLNLLVSTSYSVYPNLLVVVATRMVRLSLQHGNCDYSSVGYAIYGTLLASGGQQIEAGIKYSKYALEILDKRTNDNLRSSTLFICMFTTRSWDTSIRDIAAHHQKGYELGLAGGNFEHSAWNLLKVGWSLYAGGENLHTLYNLVTTNRQLLADLRQEVQFLFNNRLSQSITNLLGYNADPLSFTSEHFDDREFIENCVRSQYTGGILSLDIEKLILYYLFGDLENAKQASDRCYPYLEKINGQFANCLFHFYSALTLLEIDAQSGLSEHDTQKSIEHQQQLEKWAKYGPMNAQHKWELIEARRRQQLGDFAATIELYDRSIAGAKVNKFLQEEALANELAAKFYLDWGRMKIAAIYMQEAYYCYAKWGAKAKTDDLERCYPELLAPILKKSVIELDSISTLATLTNFDSLQSGDAKKIEDLDFIAVIQAAQLLAGKIEIDKLIAELSDILLKYAGAQTCIIALPNCDGKWQLKSIAKVTIDGCQYQRIDRDLAADLSDYPSNSIYWAKNSRSIFVGDATKSLPFDDLYSIERQSRSILCLPIVKQENVLGVIYLEHQDLPNLFTVNRQTVISFLANQAALALDNANLYLAAKAAKEQAQLQQSYFVALIDNIPHTAWLKDPNGKYIAVNRSMADHLGCEADDLIGKNELDLFPPELANSLMRVDRQIMLTGERCTVEENIQLPTRGSSIWVETSKTPIFSEDGTPLGIAGIAIDITDRKLAELSLQQSESRYQQIVSNIPAALFQFKIDANGQQHMNYVSSKFYELLDRPLSEDFHTIEIQTGLLPEDRERFVESIAHSARTGKAWEWESEILSPKGNRKWIRGESNPIYHDDGSILWDGILFDITQRKEIELALQASDARYQQLADNLPCALYQFEMDTNGQQHMNYVSNRIYEIFDLPLEVDSRNININIGEGIHPDDLASFTESIAISAASGEMWIWEGRFVMPSGNMKWIRGESTPTTKIDGCIVWDGVLIDISDRKQIEIALANSEHQFRGLVENSADLIYAIDLDGNFRYISPQITEILGYEPAELVGKPWMPMVDTADLPAAQATFAYTIDNSSQTDGEIQIRDRDGNLRWISFKSSPARDENGTIVGIQGIGRDITEQKAIEILRQEQAEALRQSERRYQQLADNLPGALYQLQLTPDGTIDCPYISSGCWDLFELTPAEMMADIQLAVTMIPPDEREEFRQSILASATNLTPWYWEGKAIVSAGKTKWIKCAARPEHQPDGSVLWDGMMLDITDRKQADLALQESKQFLETVLDSFPLYTFWKDRESNFLGGNQKFIKMAGMKSTAEIIGKNDYDMPWTRQESNLYRADDREVLDREIAKLGIIETHTGSEGSTLWVETNKVPLRDPHGQVIGVIGTFQDVTDRELARINLNLANERLEQTVVELQRATKLKDEFLATMSHELRTPLNAVLGMSEALQEQVFGDLNPAQLKSLKTIERSGRHLLSLINDILDLSKISAGKLELNITDFSLSYLCTSSLSFIRQQAHTKQIEIETILPPQDITLRADERRLRQVAINLLSNAVKFTPEGGRVTLQVRLVSASESQDNPPWLELSVIDTGIGIAESDIDRLCQPFTQLDSSLNRQYEGTGLGLALSKQIVELHDGSISISSKFGSGSCFTVRLPGLVNISSTSNLRAYTRPIDELDNGGTHVPASSLILLVEDNEANVHTFASYLTAKGYQTLLASNGKQALEILATHSPDAIVMDIQMPEMDGIQAIDRIRNDLQLTSMPIIALTALAMAGDREKCLAAGANDYLAKPVSLKELAAKIQQLIT